MWPVNGFVEIFLGIHGGFSDIHGRHSSTGDIEESRRVRTVFSDSDWRATLPNRTRLPGNLASQNSFQRARTVRASIYAPQRAANCRFNVARRATRIRFAGLIQLRVD